MMKAGIIEEMVEDTMEGLEDDDLEEAADTEVEKVLWELTKGAYIIMYIYFCMYTSYICVLNT